MMKNILLHKLLDWWCSGAGAERLVRGAPALPACDRQLLRGVHRGGGGQGALRTGGQGQGQPQRLDVPGSLLNSTFRENCKILKCVSRF